jgi:hypothetical protein
MPFQCLEIIRREISQSRVPEVPKVPGVPYGAFALYNHRILRN